MDVLSCGWYRSIWMPIWSCHASCTHLIFPISEYFNIMWCISSCDAFLPNLIFMWCISSISIFHCLLFHILVSSLIFFYDRSLDLLFQLMFVCIYRWNIFLWYISIVGKYLKWKNHIDPFILNEMIIGSPHILSSPSLYISISYFHLLIHCLLFHIHISSFHFFYDRSLDLLFQLMFVCIYRWNIFL